MISADVIRIINNYRVVALAVSGGSDSMAMCEWFRRNRPIDSFLIVNIDHHIRGSESAEDSDFVRRYAEKYGIKYLHYDVYAREEGGKSLEQAARELRHAIFRQVCQEYADVVATAHHQGDQAESVLLHLFRGSGIDGLRGMSVCDGYLIRPLIYTAKSEIMRYIDECGVSYREDSTNTDISYSRNYLRREIIPRLESKFDGVVPAILRVAERAREVADYIDSETPAIEREGDAVVFNISQYHQVIAAEMIRRAFSLLGVEQDIEERHIKLVCDLQTRPNGTSLDMPYGIRAYSEYGNIALVLDREPELYEYTFGEGVYYCDGQEMAVERVPRREGDGLFIAVDGLEGLVIRPRRERDRIEKFGGGSKSLGDFMTDKKVPLRLRDRLPVIAMSDNVLCVAGVEIARTVKVTDASREIYKITLINE